ncbi:hypothetical protein JWG39_03705 [Desulforhopalus vacuolatus]|uniref:hypothetical protein n=1 Tax=Desulforhopalus vacuolatus TaxID=40414 RepID=UPI001966A4FD|nr:hypothetical protein [Desulforhopalus vacuolatus]MBM9518919.1 hypothetical protein [Desulforhopalus vacuolatus]
MKRINHRFFISLGTFCVCFLFFTIPAYCDGLPLELRHSGDRYTVYNRGECTIYKLHVKSVPPKKEGVVNFFSRLGAEVVSIGSFSKTLDNIEKGESLSFNRSELTSSKGEKLITDFVIGSLIFEGSTCGECGLTIEFEAE